MFDKYILVNTEEPSKFFEGVEELTNLYVDTGFTDQILIHKSKVNPKEFVITFPVQPDFECFKYFVNYLYYPEAGRSGKTIKGYWTLAQNDELPKELIGSRVMLYVSDNDTEYDNVFCAFDSISENYKLGFARGEEFVKLPLSEMIFFEASINRADFQLIEIIEPVKIDSEERPAFTKIRNGCFMLFAIIFIISIATMVYF